MTWFLEARQQMSEVFEILQIFLEHTPSVGTCFRACDFEEESMPSLYVSYHR